MVPNNFLWSQEPGHFTGKVCITLVMNKIPMNMPYQSLEEHYPNLMKII